MHAEEFSSYAARLYFDLCILLAIAKRRHFPNAIEKSHRHFVEIADAWFLIRYIRFASAKRCAFWYTETRFLVRYPRCALGGIDLVEGCTVKSAAISNRGIRHEKESSSVA